MAHQNLKLHFLHIWCDTALSIWFSLKMVVNHIKVIFFFFQNLKTELTNLVSIKSYGSLKIVYRFSIFAQKYCSKALLGHYHCTKFPVSNISTSRDMGSGQNEPPRPTQTQKSAGNDRAKIRQKPLKFIRK